MSTHQFRIDQRNQLRESPRRTSRACAGCHVRKVRCDVSVARPECSNCQRDGQPCRPRPRQPRRAAQRTAAAAAVDRPLEQTETNLCPAEPATSSAAVPSGAYQQGYMQRASFMSHDGLRAQDGHEPGYASVVSHESIVSRQICDLQQAYTLPSRAIQLALFENFWEYCYPWDPIIEKSQIMDVPLETLSPLLLQSIFLGGIRLAAASLPTVTSYDFYLRAKTLFWCDQERNPMTKLIAVSLLHWWNPHGPELVSTNTSTFWNRIAISLAMQMGLNSAQRKVPEESLRRRVWWSLVARDCLISAAHGRPQAINLDYCDVPQPTIKDFPSSSTVAPVFVAYVKLALIIGKFVNLSITKFPTEKQVFDIGELLRQWMEALPPTLHLMHSSCTSSHQSTSNVFEVRQLNITFYAAVAMLYRARTSDGPFPTAAVLAGSTIAAIFEEFLARDQVRHLGPVFTFYLLVASVALLSCHRYHGLWKVAQEDLRIISHAQEEIKKKWPSAIGSIRSFGRMYEITIASTQDRARAIPPQQLGFTESILLKDMNDNSCRLWRALEITTDTTSGAAEHSKAGQFQATGPPPPNADYYGYVTQRMDEFRAHSGFEDSTMAFEEPDWSAMLLDEHTWQPEDSFFGGHLFWDELSYEPNEEGAC